MKKEVILENISEESSLKLEQKTRQDIASALWLDEFDETKISQQILKNLAKEKNSNHAFGMRMNKYMNWLLDRPQSHNPNYSKRYTTLKKYCSQLTPQQAYIFNSKFMGNNSIQGYDPMPAGADIQFPESHLPKPNTQVGWHFFVGSGWDEKGKEYGIECMFFRVALLPPELAKELGLSEQENQVVEIQLGISEEGTRHYQADPILIAGTTGLISWNQSPFKYNVGKNCISTTKKEGLWPLSIVAEGTERGQNSHTKLAINLTFTSGKEYLFQGDDGCMPCIDGMGSLYYSIPNLVLQAGSSITIADKKVTLKKGTFWFDHQWGFLSGNPQSSVLRAANNISKPNPAGWDWYMAQFKGDRQITMFAAHSKVFSSFYFQTGAKPPGVMTVDVAGKYMDENKKLHNTWGTLKVTGWVKAERSPNTELYPITHTWHPNKWEFVFDETMPEDIREFSMSQIVEGGQINFFANGSQYNEGAVILKDKKGLDIGRGFAEAVQYADTFENMLDLAGIFDQKDRAILAPQSDSLFGRAKSLVYILTHQNQLKVILASGKGLEFFSKPKPAKKPVSRH
ncbi:ATP-binding protein [Candidatus Saccharibacteria bacterium]|nr:ATP-binding protein [Candidatus Saccharibacteria bacterium]